MKGKYSLATKYGTKKMANIFFTSSVVVSKYILKRTEIHILTNKPKKNETGYIIWLAQ